MRENDEIITGWYWTYTNQSSCMKANCMKNRESTDSLCIWSVELIELLWHMLSGCFSLLLNSFYIQDSISRKQKAWSVKIFKKALWSKPTEVELKERTNQLGGFCTVTGESFYWSRVYRSENLEREKGTKGKNKCKTRCWQRNATPLLVALGTWLSFISESYLSVLGLLTFSKKDFQIYKEAW